MNNIARPFGPNTATQASIAALTSARVELGVSVDMLDTESMLAFFEMKMGDAKAKLNTLIQEQEAVNARVTTLQSLEAKLSSFAESGIKPGDPGWDDFVATARQAQEVVGASSKAGQDIQALVDEATKPTIVDVRYDDAFAAKAIADKYGKSIEYGQKIGPTGMEAGPPGWIVEQVPEGPARGLSKEGVGKLIAQTKAFREGMQSDGQIRMIKVQQAVEQSSQLVNLASNIMRKLNEMAMAPINNMRG